MKKIFKLLGLFIGFLLIILVSAATFIHFRGIPTYKVEKVDFRLTSTPESIARGKKLTLMLCAGCHKNRETGKLTGT